MKDKVQKIREEVARMHDLLPVMDGDNISVNYADRICTTLEMYIDSLQKEPVSKEIGDYDHKAVMESLCPQLKEEPTIPDIVDEHFWKMLGEEHVSEDLGEYINELSKQFQEVSFAKLSRIAVRVANWQKAKMMAKAIDVKINRDTLYDLKPFIHEKYLDYKIGDKVKVIVIKEG